MRALLPMHVSDGPSLSPSVLSASSAPQISPDLHFQVVLLIILFVVLVKHGYLFVVMALSEISNNIRRSMSNARDKAACDAVSLSTPPLPASAIQSMLKTTTELGDLGQFAVRNSRLPRSGSRLQPLRPRSGSFDTSFASALRHDRHSHGRRTGRHQGPRPAASSSGLARRNISQSNLSSYTNASRRRRYPPGPHPYALPGLASPGHGPRGLYHHRSLVTLRSHSSIPFRSPMMNPTASRKPGHRASSPAHSDMRSMTHNARPPHMRAPSVGTLASSPGSAFPRNRGHPGYRPDLNASYTSLTRLPSPAVSFRRNSPFPGLVPLRTPTPSSMMSHHQQGMLSNNPLIGIPKSPTGSTVPHYYDYSESFIEEDCFSPDGAPDIAQPPLSMDYTVLEGAPMPPPRHAQTPFGTMQGSSFHPVELPTAHNRRPSEKSSSQPSFHGVIPKRISSLGAPALHQNGSDVSWSLPPSPNHTKSALVPTRRTRSVDSGRSGCAKAGKDARRASITSRRSCTPSTSSIFFPNAARSSRDLTTLAARVHSPLAGTRTGLAKAARATLQANYHDPNLNGNDVQVDTRSPQNMLPTFAFRPISLEWYTPSPSARPRTSEATPLRKMPEILSPMPERPMSSQSRKRFSKILELEDAFNSVQAERSFKPFSCVKPPDLKKVNEVPNHRLSLVSDGTATSASFGSPVPSFAQDDTWAQAGTRISRVTSHDKSTIASLLDKHIECLGLQPDSEVDSDGTTSLKDRRVESMSGGESTIKLTDLLTPALTWGMGRPLTSSSYRTSTLTSLEKQRLRPRRLFASMDARVPPKTSIERPTASLVSDLENKNKASRPPYGWQTLPSMSHLVSEPSAVVNSPTSGELGDVDSSDQHMKFKVRRRSNLSMGTSVASHLSQSAISMLTERKEITPHRRSKSEVLARQESHRRRRMRIRLKLKTKSKTVGDLAIDGIADNVHEDGHMVQPVLAKKASKRRSSINSPVQGYAELSGDSIMPSKPVSPRAQSPSIPTRWSSIIAAMPEPGRRVAEVIRKASIRTTRSQRSHTSIVEPVNTSRLNAPLPRLGSIPRLAPPEFGPPLTSSDLNLSLPYAEVPSTIRPTLRETKSFFSDDSSAQRQRTSIRQKLHLHSLRHVLPGSAGTSPLAHCSNGTSGETVKLSYSCQMTGRDLEEGSSLPQEMMPMSEFTYRKRKVLDRVKGWWRRQCMSRMYRKRGERAGPGVLGW